MVQRLDKGTSGAMVIAKTQRTAGRMSEKFKERLVEKTYIGLCYGVPKMGAGEGFSYSGTVVTNLEFNPATLK